MRSVWISMLTGLMLTTAAWAAPGDLNSPMKTLIDEMKAHADTEKAFREGKKKEIVEIESQIDGLRADAKAKGATKDPDAVKPLQLKRLAILEEVAQRDIQTAEQSLKFAQRKLDIAKQNLAAFEAKKAEAQKTLGA